MNILFLSLDDFNSYQKRGLYTDLLREFIKNGHSVFSISPIERRRKQKTCIINEHGNKILKLKIGNIQKTSFIEKGISTVLLEKTVIKGLKRYFYEENFDLILYATPPITFQKVVKYVKKRDNAKSYLLLKDIWPQGIIDMQALTKKGWKGIIYRYFRNKEKKIYLLSDYIGCMSQANVDYVLNNNDYIQKDKVEICPNCIEPICINKDEKTILTIKEKYSIPVNRIIFAYGGNLGIPQGIDFLMECLNSNYSNDKVYFIIAGSGTEFNRLENFIVNNELNNVKLFNQLPKEDYDLLISACDVGLIFLDKRFTIPNFPSRILSYMQASMPVLAATDRNTDMGQIIEKGQFGYWCESGDICSYNQKLHLLCNLETRRIMGANARIFLEENYSVGYSYKIIMNHFKKGN